MTVVNIDLTQPSGRGDGAAVPARGQVTFTPSRRVSHNGAVQLPAPVVARLVDGHAEVDIIPNGGSWYWRVLEAIPYGRRRAVSVPAAAAVEYEDLPDIDPSSFEELPENAPPGWYADLAGEVGGKADADDVADALAGKADAQALASGLAAKADAATLPAAMGDAIAADDPAIVLPLKAQIDEANAAAGFARRRAFRLAALGDSNTKNGWDPFDVGGGLIVTLADSWLRWVEAYSCYGVSVVYNGGVIGDKTADMLARLPNVVASDADAVTVMGGTNDILGSVSLATIQANLSTMYETIVAAGKIVLAMEVLPASQYGSAQLLKLAQLNAWIGEYARTHPGVLVVPFYSELANPANGSANTDLLRLESGNYLHLRAGGAMRIARRVWDVLKTIVPPFDPALGFNGHPLNAIGNGLMLGDVSGVATGWAVSTPDSAVYTVSKVARTDGRPGEWQRISVTSGTVYLDYVSTQAGNVAWTSTTQALISEFEVVGDATNLTQFDVATFAENSSAGVHKRSYGFFDSYTSPKRGPIPSPILMRTYPLSGYNVAATKARSRITLKGAGTLDIGRAALRTA